MLKRADISFEALAFQDVRKSYGAVEALRGLSFVVERGESVALLGRNGAGKTTAVSLALGLSTADAGQVRTLGLRPGSEEAKLQTGVMLQEAALPDQLTVREAVQLFSTYYRSPRSVDEVLSRAGVQHLQGRRYRALSGGERRRAQFAAAICGGPALLVLDEPTAGMDIDARRIMWSIIREERARGSTLLLTSHDMIEVEAVSDRVLVIAHGAVVADGAPGEVAASKGQAKVVCVTALSEAVLRALPGVTGVTRSGRKAELHSRDPEATLRALLMQDPDVREVEVRKASLEDAFLDLSVTP